MRRAIRAAAASVLALAASVSLASPALAHASLVASDPGDGASISEVPREIRLWFDEPVRLELSAFEVAGLDTGSVPIREIAGSSTGRGLVILRLPPLERGAYSVSWRVLSEDDTHVTEGIILFGIGVPISATEAAENELAAPVVPPVDVGLRWLELVLLAGLVGSLAVCRLVLAPRSEPAMVGGLRLAASRRIMAFALWSGLGALVVELGVLLWQARRVADGIAGSSLLSVLVRLLSGGWWLRLAILGGLTLLAANIRRAVGAPRHLAGSAEQGKGHRGWAWPLCAGLVLALAVVEADSSHAATVSPNGWLALLAEAAHFLAACIWVGGVLAIAMSSFPLRRRSDAASLLRATWRPFSWMAALSVGVLASTGLYSASRQVASADAAITTPYGEALLVKIGLVALAATVGLVNAVALHPTFAAPLARRLGRPAGWTPVSISRLPRMLLVEAMLGILAFGMVGVMSSTPPARGPRFEPRAEPAPSSLSRQADDLLVTLSVEPNLPGQNVAVVRAASTRRPAPAEIGAVTLTVSPVSGDEPASLPMEPAGPDRFQVGIEQLGEPGRWNLSVHIDRAGLPAVATTFDWTVPAPGPGRTPVFSDRPLGPALVTAAVGAGLLVMAIAAVVGTRRILPRSWPRSRPHAGSPALITDGLPTSSVSERTMP